MSSVIEVSKKRRVRRKKIYGTTSKPRLSIFKSNKYIYVQAIDDSVGKTLASASSFVLDKKSSKLNKETAEKVGVEIAVKLKEKNIDTVVFDRNGFLYTGRIKALADAARKNGLKF